jgi:ABC-type transport system substrate-binding protein
VCQLFSNPARSHEPLQKIANGKLDGKGLPPNFFSDINVRKAFLHAFDRKTYAQDVFNNLVIMPLNPKFKIEVQIELEYWSAGVLQKTGSDCRAESNTPLLHHSNAAPKSKSWCMTGLGRINSPALSANESFSQNFSL